MSTLPNLPLHQSSQSDIDEIENLIHASVLSSSATILPACPPSPPCASIPLATTFPFHFSTYNHQQQWKEKKKKKTTTNTTFPFLFQHSHHRVNCSRTARFLKP
ncbi:hypothetical protein ACB094_05G017100 [Castanea mollissima]